MYEPIAQIPKSLQLFIMVPLRVLFLECIPYRIPPFFSVVDSCQTDFVFCPFAEILDGIDSGFGFLFKFPPATGAKCFGTKFQSVHKPWFFVILEKVPGRSTEFEKFDKHLAQSFGDTFWVE